MKQFYENLTVALGRALTLNRDDFKRQDGQGATEYGIVIAFVVLSIALTIGLMGTAIVAFLGRVAGKLDGLIHVNTQMLDRLKRADCLTELLSVFCIFDGEVHDCPCGAERVGGSGDQHVVNHRCYVFRRRRGQSLPGCCMNAVR